VKIEYFKPTVKDIKTMQGLVSSYVKDGTILHRTDDEIATTIRSYTCAKAGRSIVGFVATHIHSIALAEIRSLIVKKSFQSKGIGKKLVQMSLEEAENYKISRVLSLTYKKEFFEKLNFKIIEKEKIPEHKIWADCIRCKHFPICDEIALEYEIKSKCHANN